MEIFQFLGYAQDLIEGKLFREQVLMTSMPRCKAKGCKVKNATFGFEGGKGSCCKKHAEVGMVDVKSKRCEHVGCDVQPYYDFKGGKGRFCKEHAQVGMVNVKSKRCEHLGCDVQPNYDIKRGKGRFCKEHAEVGMVNVKSKRCEHVGCDVRPSYDVRGGKGRFCKEHAEEGMVNVKSKRCEYVGCDVQPWYGHPGHIPTRCARHKLPRMIPYPRKTCIKKGCNALACYAELGDKQTYCAIHIPEDINVTYVNVIEQCCISCGLQEIVDKDGKCKTCDPEVFARGRLAKQNELENYLRTNVSWLFEECNNQVDRMVDKGICGKERPDFLFDMGDKYFIIECDENQHKERPCECEQTRMVNIAQSLGGIPVVFLRYNPDMYIDENGNMGKVTKNKRMETIGKFAKYVKDEWKPVEGHIAFVAYMFYDGKQDYEVTTLV
jgi:hypothetical protein